ncbi:MAG TPA: M56 family metallopeptidase [Thermoanaerobaculia bacterium]
MTFFHALALASIAAVALGLLVQQTLRDASARHAVLLAALLLPPVLLLVAVAGLRLPAASVVTTDVIVEASKPAAAVAVSGNPKLSALVVTLWLAGVAVAVARIVAHILRWRGVAVRAELVNGLTRSAEVREPTVIGIVRPVIVLPAAYDFTPAELDAVLAHEQAHISRRDNLIALVVELVCAAFWFDPLHRVARRKLVELRERAVDDAVLERGCDAEAYVSALARSCETSVHRAVACMSRLNLQERMESIMSHSIRHRWPVSLTRGFIAAGVAAAAIAFATFAPAPSLSAGDAPVGIPDFDVRATPQPGGGYTLDVRVDLPDGPFTSSAVVASAPETRSISTTQGGKTYEVVVKLEADGLVRGSLMISEGGEVVAARSKWFDRREPKPGVYPSGTDNLTPPKPVHKVDAVYTSEAKAARIAGVVIVKVTIDAQGNVTDARVLKDLPLGLGQAAVDAVRQWKFEPATLDGKPVATDFNLTVRFVPD